MEGHILTFCIFSLIATISSGENVNPIVKRFIFPSGGDTGGFPSNPFGGGSRTGGYHACVPSQSQCNLQCNGGYMKGPQNCDFCICAAAQQNSGPSPAPQQNSGITLAPSTSTSVPLTQGITSSHAPSTSRDPCDAAKTLCAASCGNGGYLVDPTDCTFCICKSDVHTSG